MINPFKYQGNLPVNRQQQIAQALLSGALNPQQMTSPFQVLGNLAQAYVGKQMMEQVGERQAGERKSIQEALMGKPATSPIPQGIAAPETLARTPGILPDIGGMTGQPNLMAQAPGQPAVAPDRKKALALMLGSSDPMLQKIGMAGLLEKPKETWGESFVGPRGSLLQRSSGGKLAQVVGPTKEPLVQFGGPVDKSAPWANIQDPKKRDEARIRFGVKADTNMAKMRDVADKAVNTNQQIDRFVYLNEKNRTGKEYGVPLLGGALEMGRSAFDPEFQEMKSISDRLTPAMRQGMPGAASDRDVAMFRGATLGVEKSPQVNANIAIGLKTANDNKIQKSNAYSDYVSQRGHDRGFDAQWKQYLNANPIFDPTMPEGSYTPNQSRMSYDQWISAGMPQSTQLLKKTGQWSIKEIK